MMTLLTIYRVGAEPVRQSIELPERPNFHQLKRIMEPLLGGRMGHHYLTHEGVKVDLFDDYDAIRKMLPKNPAASAIYSADMLARRPQAKLIPVILGPAVLTDRQVWWS